MTPSRQPSEQAPLHSPVYNRDMDRLADKLEETGTATVQLKVHLERIDRNIVDLSSSTKRLEDYLIRTREELYNKLAKMETMVEEQKKVVEILHEEIYGNGKHGLKSQVAAIFAVSSAVAVILSFIVNISFVFFSGK